MSSGLMSTRPLERICPSLPNSAKSVLLPVPPLRMGTPSRMMSGWLFPVMEVSPRTLMETAPAEPPCVCVMRTPRCFTVHGRGKVGCSCLYQFVCTDGTDGITDTFRIFFDTHCRYYDFFQLLGIFAECKSSGRLAFFRFCQVYLPGGVAHVSDRECCICRNGQCEVAVHIGNDAVVGYLSV